MKVKEKKRNGFNYYVVAMSIISIFFFDTIIVADRNGRDLDASKEYLESNKKEEENLSRIGNETKTNLLQDCVDPDTSIIAWWPMDEDTGTVVADIVGNNPGVRINGPTHVQGIVGNSLRFDGSNDYVGLPDNDLWAFGTRNFTIEFWANFDAPGGGTVGHPGDVFISNNEGSGTRKKWFFALGGGVLNFHVNGSNNNGFFPQVPFSPAVGQWYHLAITRNGNIFKIYIDGIPKGSATRNVNIPNPNAPLVIGRANEPFGGYMNGRLDEMTIYNNALSDEEILAIYNAGNEGKCKNLAIVSDSVLIVQLADSFFFQFDAIFGEPPLTWSVVEGEEVLPSGVTLSSDGILSGTPTEAADYTFTIRVTDNKNDIADKIFTLKVLITLPPSDLRISKTGTIAVPGRTIDYFILIENIGSVIANNVEVAELLNPRQVSLLSIDPPGVADDSVHASASLLYWIIPDLAPGEVEILSYQVELSPTVPLGATVSGGWVCTGQQMADKLGQCLFDLSTTSSGCAECVDECTLSPLCISLCRIPTVPTIATCIACLLPCIDCLLIGAMGGGTGGCLQDVGDAIGCFSDFFEDCFSHDQPAIGPLDPNEKLVIAERYILPNQALVYPIHFENIGEIEAKDVFITDTLDPNLDITSLEILTPNGSSFDPVTRTVKWELLNRNLPPGESDNVLISIKPLPGLPSGSEIRNKADIQFEVFDIFTTNEVINIIDTTPPSSHMIPLPTTTTNLEFPISWAGTDSIGEIANYSIFVAVDGSGFSLLAERIPDTTMMFNATPGHTYSFLTIAEDLAGNIEIKDAVAEATIEVILPSNFTLLQNYPNPFNNATTITYEVPRSSHVTLKIYDVLGREVVKLVDEKKEAGRYEFFWEPKNIASGVYLYRLQAGEFSQAKRMILVK